MSRGINDFSKLKEETEKNKKIIHEHSKKVNENRNHEKNLELKNTTTKEFNTKQTQYRRKN